MRVVAPSSPQFASTLVVDLGASRKQGTLKMALYDQNQQRVGDEWTGLVSRYRSNDTPSFLASFSKRINEYLASCQKKGFSFTEDPLTSVVMAVPSAIRTHKSGSPYVNYFSNIQTPANQPIADVRFDQLHIDPRYSKHAPQARKLQVVNDMMGSGAQVARHLITKGLLPKNASAVYIMAGGGLGVIKINRHSGWVRLEAQEMGCYIPSTFGQTQEKSALSVDGMRNNFINALEKLGYNSKQLEAAFKKAQNNRGKLITNYADAYQYIPGLTPDQHKQASLAAYLKAQEQLASLMSAYRATGFTNTFVMGGPLISGLVQWSQDHYDLIDKQAWPNTSNAELFNAIEPLTLRWYDKPDYLFRKGLVEWLVRGYSTPLSLSFLMSSDQSEPILNIHTDIPVANNVEGSLLLRHARPVGPPGFESGVQLIRERDLIA